MKKHRSQNPLDYNVEKLRQVAGLQPDENDTDEMPEPTHECQQCGYLAEVNDYQKHTPNWCDSCEKVTTFERLK